MEVPGWNPRERHPLPARQKAGKGDLDPCQGALCKPDLRLSFVAWGGGWGYGPQKQRGSLLRPLNLQEAGVDQKSSLQPKFCIPRIPSCSMQEQSLSRLPGTLAYIWQSTDQLKARVVVTQQQATEAESQLQELQQQSSQIESSASTLASVVASRFSSLAQALEKRKALTLRSIEQAKKQVLGQALNEIQRLTGHLEALSQYDHSVQELLGQVDDHIFFQGLQQLSEPVESLGPPTALQWDEEQQLNNVNELLSPLCELLLEDKPSRVAGKAAQAGPVEALGPPPPVPSTMCPLRKKLWQNYRNLTFDPDTANQYLYLSHEDQQVTHRFQAQSPVRPGSFELWQVQCTQSFQTGQHYWEVRASEHSVTLGVTYPKLSRRKVGNHTDNIGRGPYSWGLCIQEDSIQAWHNGKAERLHGAPGLLLGIDLNLTSGCLNFYSLEPRTERLHTFYAVFSQPLFPVFWLLEGRTLTLCHQPEAKLPPGPREEASALC
ncbi:tripartite motif-containing protein 65 [Cricetulus griseus]|nr:tripartite motif-containing protein 65 [Cricetulus griseus]